ncbi:phosphatase PAP2 family protein [Pseudalkalibacillus salsuginis]|uniref:phosphatase PAP2 family protein n=1 Tax=Pseudalkalibacillus salsuginis TaxID=2910972 RepID=UPI001F385149|nr:phosphatase PAP2 family protein [Pseudalkalibacillus salsuginis]MCF6410370.1 phosphatase PAP2 family protein [Pseudalkalibacillus salsuginis]
MVDHNTFKTKKAFEKISLELIAGILAALAFIWVFAGLSNELLENELQGFDTFISNVIYNLQTPWMTNFMIFMTHAGDTYTYVVLVSILLIFLLRKQLKWEAFILLIAVLGAWGLNTVLKGLFQRERPELEHLVEVGGYSFPSGHAMVSIAAYGIMGYLLVQYLRRKGKQYWPVVLVVSLWIFLIGLSRIYLYVHYPSDVIAGYSAGGVWLLSCIYALTILNRRTERRKVNG